MLKINKWFGTVFLIGNGARQTPVTLWPTTYSLGHDMEVPCPNWCGCPSAKFLISTPKLTPNHHHDTLLLDTEQINAISCETELPKVQYRFQVFFQGFSPEQEPCSNSTTAKHKIIQPEISPTTCRYLCQCARRNRRQSLGCFFIQKRRGWCPWKLQAKDLMNLRRTADESPFSA